MNRNYIASSVIALSVVLFWPLDVQAGSTLCTMEYNPVCGQPPMPECSAGMMCPQVLPQPKIYSNTCVLSSEKAKELPMKECENREPTKNSSHMTCDQNAGYSWDADLQKCIDPNEMTTLIEWAHTLGLTKYPDIKNFSPELAMTRQEAAAFATRIAAEFMDRDADMIAVKMRSYDDQNSIDTSLQGDVMKARFLGIMNWYNNTFSPKRTLTWAESAATLVRILDGVSTDSTDPWYQANIERLSIYDGSIWASLDAKTLNSPITRGQFMKEVYTIFHINDENSTPTPTVSVDSAIIGDWKLESYNWKKMIDLGVTVAPSMNLGDWSLEARFCNSLFTSFETSSGKLITTPMNSTLMACQGSLGEMELQFADLNNASYTITGTSTNPILTIKTRSNNTFVFTLGTPNTTTTQLHDAIQGDWKLIGYKNMSYADITSKNYNTVTLSIKDNALSTKFCNSLSGTFTLSGNVVSTSGLMSTRMACSDATLMEMENNFNMNWATIAQNTLYFVGESTIPSNQLTITTTSWVVYTFGRK